MRQCGSLVVAMEVANLVLDLRLQGLGDVLEVLVVRVMILHHDCILKADQIVQLRRAVLVGAGAAVVEDTVGSARAGVVPVVAAADVGWRRCLRRAGHAAVVDGGLVLMAFWDGVGGGFVRGSEGGGREVGCLVGALGYNALLVSSWSWLALSVWQDGHKVKERANTEERIKKKVENQ